MQELFWTVHEIYIVGIYRQSGSGEMYLSTCVHNVVFTTVEENFAQSMRVGTGVMCVYDSNTTPFYL